MGRAWEQKSRQQQQQQQRRRRRRQQKQQLQALHHRKSIVSAGQRCHLPHTTRSGALFAVSLA
jgi:hypothetical protein